MNPELRSGRQQGKVFPYADLHCDTLYVAWRRGEKDIFHTDGAMADVSEILRGGCRLQLYAIFMPDEEDIRSFTRPYPGDDAYIREAHDIFLHTVREHGEVFTRAGSMAEVDQNAAAGKASGMLSMEDGRAVQGRPERLRALYDLGVRVMGLTWNHANCFGYPNSTEPEIMQKGLTDFGREAISCMEEMGMLIDASHLSDGGFWDLIRLCHRPFIASHSNCRALNPHPRSMTDEMIRALADRGGVLGLNFCRLFLTQDLEQQRSTVDALAAQLRHRIRVGGLECAALGTDFDGIGGDLEIPTAGRMQDFFGALRQRGFTSRELDYICLKNTERVFREVIG